jgi:hypothetical protein
VATAPISAARRCAARRFRSASSSIIRSISEGALRLFRPPSPTPTGGPNLEHPVVAAAAAAAEAEATTTSKTGIIIDALSSKSNIQVSLASNKDGEGYPLVYVLVCRATSAITRM